MPVGVWESMNADSQQSRPNPQIQDTHTDEISSPFWSTWTWTLGLGEVEMESGLEASTRSHGPNLEARARKRFALEAKHA